MPGATPPRTWSFDSFELSYGDTKLGPEDLRLLDPPNWINDNILAFWLEYLETHLMPGLQRRGAVLLSPQVVQLLRRQSVEDVREILKSHNMASKQNLWVLPINDCNVNEAGGTHWSLLVYRQGHSFEHYNSLKRFNSNYEVARQVASLLAQAFHLDNKGKVEEMPCVQQTNGYDCGIHVICNARAVCLQLLSPEAAQHSVLEIATRDIIDEARDELKDILMRFIKEQNEK